MPYDIRIVPVDERREMIRERADEAKKHNRLESFFAFSQDLQLAVITLPIDVPIYRLNNARTKSWQLSYLEDHSDEIPTTFFESNENLAAQKIQHEQLVTLSKKGVSDDPSIWMVLEEDRRQTETLLITADGVVLNGNRRLAAMRELASSIDGFNHVKVAVLERHLQERDLLEIEARLQVAPDVRLPYDWTDEALLIMSMRSAGLLDDRIAKILRKNDAEDVQTLIDRFNEGRLFLKDALGEASNYQKLVPHEQNFTELTKAIKKASAEEKEVSRVLCNAITKHSTDATRRLYDYRVLYGKERELALSEFAKRKNIDLKRADIGGNGAQADPDDLFEDSGGEPTLFDKYEPVLKVLKDSVKSEENASILREIGDDILEVRNSEKTKSLALAKVKRAQLLLEQVTLEKADPSTFEEILKALDAVQAITQKIRERIERHVSHR